MRYLQRQRKSVISSIGFKRPAGILLVLMLLFTAFFTEDTIDCRESSNAGRQKEMLFAVSSVVDHDRYLTRESTGQRTAELLQSGMSRQFVRLLHNRMNPIAAAMLPSVLPELFKQYWSMGCKEREGILPWSMMLVKYIRNADGEKNEFAASIK